MQVLKEQLQGTQQFLEIYGRPQCRTASWKSGVHLSSMPAEIDLLYR